MNFEMFVGTNHCLSCFVIENETERSGGYLNLVEIASN